MILNLLYSQASINGVDSFLPKLTEYALMFASFSIRNLIIDKFPVLQASKSGVY